MFVSTLNGNLPFKLGIDSSGNYGYIKAGADSVTPFKYHYHGSKGQYNPAGTHKFRIDLTGSYIIFCTHNGGSLWAKIEIENGKIIYTLSGNTQKDTYKFSWNLSGTTLSITATGIPYYTYAWAGDKDLVTIS